jgi:hypothetical protein
MNKGNVPSLHAASGLFVAQFGNVHLTTGKAESAGTRPISQLSSPQPLIACSNRRSFQHLKKPESGASFPSGHRHPHVCLSAFRELIALGSRRYLHSQQSRLHYLTQAQRFRCDPSCGLNLASVLFSHLADKLPTDSANIRPKVDFVSAST